MKALEIEAKANIDDGFNDFAKGLIDEAIAELEALQQPKSCEGVCT